MWRLGNYHFPHIPLAHALLLLSIGNTKADAPFPISRSANSEHLCSPRTDRPIFPYATNWAELRPLKLPRSTLYLFPYPRWTSPPPISHFRESILRPPPRFFLNYFYSCYYHIYTSFGSVRSILSSDKEDISRFDLANICVHRHQELTISNGDRKW